jgi:hypothetical protein
MGITSSTATINAGGSTKTIFGNFNIKLLIYILIAIIIEYVVASIAMKANQYILLAIFIPLSLYIFVIYGQRWFGPDGPYTNSVVQWPPAMNTCPDFLTAYTFPKNGSIPAIKGCVDTIGVSRNSTFLKLPSSGTPTAHPNATISAGDATGAAKSYSTTDFFPIQIAGETPTQLCSRLQTAGLTWEGIYDGENCYSAGSIISGGGAAAAAICR